MTTQYPPPGTEANQYHHSYPSASADDSNGHLQFSQSGNAVDPSLEPDVAALQQLRDAATSASQEAHVSEAAAQAASQAAIAAAQQAQAAKNRRVNQACDACSQRKVKCDEGTPCKNCRDLDVACTRNRQRRRRGPPNKVKERIEDEKRVRTGYDQDVSSAAMVSHGPHSFGGQTQLTTDLIAPAEIISQLLSAFFAYIYPLHPFPHEQWLTQAYQRREDIGTTTPKMFLALVASMVALVAALRPHQSVHLAVSVGYTDIQSFIQRARTVCKDARGVDYLDHEHLDANSAATSYFLALLAAHGGDWRQYERYLGEAVFILHAAANSPQNEMLNQTGCRVFWAIFLLSRAMENREHAGIAKPRLPYEPMLPYPEAVPDELIQHDRILNETSGHGNNNPSVLALSALIRLYSAGDVPYTGSTAAIRTAFLEALVSIRHTFNSISQSMIHMVNAPSGQRADADGSLRIRVEIQRANVMLHSLLLRAQIVDRATAELTKEGATISPADNNTLSQEREYLAMGLLFLLKDISPPALEPDPKGFMEAVHKILNTLFKDPKILASSYGGPLQTFDQLFTSIAQGMGVWADTQEFEALADLRQKQDEFSNNEVGLDLTSFS